MATAEPSKFRLIPARVGLNAVAVFQGRNLQAGTAILKNKMYGFFNIMTKIILSILIGLLFIFNLACQSGATSNSNANSAQKDLPPGITTVPIQPSGNSTPGIPDTTIANATVPPKGATPTPGIPDPKLAGKPLPKGATPTPGIPDPETLRRQMNAPASNANTSNPPASDANSTTSGEGKPRTTRKP